MKTTDPDINSKPVRRPRVRLPFEKRRSDVGEWVYDHRTGLCVTLIAYLVLAIAFVGGKIVIDDTPHDETIYIDLQALADLEAEKARLEKQTQQQQRDNTDWRSIQNLVSNENAKEVGAKGSSGISEPVGDKALRERMKANRDAYEKGLAEEQAILNGKPHENASEQGGDQRVKGRVTVSYSFPDPVRTHRAHCLEIPAYQCEGGGEVVVEAVLSRSGDVISARVESGGDDCMRETALRAARRSRFNNNGSAPAKQIGTITYIFIPQ
ncbi:MAG: energy transducer TonB [Alistipes sp.]